MEINLYPKVKAVLIPLFIFILAFSIRIAYLEQIKTNPFFEPDAGGLDDSFYHAWAKEIAAGNVVGKEVFWGLPLYPYFLGLVYFLTGCSVYAAFFMQFVIGSLNCVLVYYIGKRVFSEAAGILSGVMLALYRPSIFYEGLRSASFLSLFLNCIIILLILRIIEKPFLRGWLLTGVLIGLSGLSSAAIFMFLPFLLFWILRYYQDGKKMICCVLVLAGVLLIIGATAVRNYLVAKDFVPVTCHSGITFYASNNPDSFGLFHLPQDLGGNINLIRTNSKVYAEQVLKKQLKPSQ